MPRSRILLLLALLAVLTYLPAVTQPLMEDDFPNILLALTVGAPHALKELAAGALRLRATSEWLFYAMYHLFGMNPVPYYCVNIALHVLNTWLVYALGSWRPVGFGISVWAAAFFAVAEGHQEAIMWFSACNELLMFLFGMSALICWLRFLETRRLGYYAGAVISFVFCLVSKESAVIFAPLLLLPLFLNGHKGRDAAWLVPLLLLACGAAFLIYDSRTWSFRFQDRSFSLHAPFWLILPKNLLRMLWPWGLLGGGAVLWTGRLRRVAALGLLWMAISLVPYSFLVYSTEIPSRQTYLASAGLALIVAAGLLPIQERYAAERRPLTAAVCVLVLAVNIGYLWTRKRRQFAERAAPTEQLIALALRTRGPIFIECFPRPGIIAEAAVHLGAHQPGRKIFWDPAQARNAGATVTFCYPQRAR
ncbi:MAG TPA: glycosyltransferase family 39 protein [Bryobacteraceae bacterium]|nr:glycosyltransferase family 39 protein [Bryobacteraceae bacterium]